MKNAVSLLFYMVAFVVTAVAQTPTTKNDQLEVKLTHADWHATRNPWHLGCADCAGLPQAAVDYKVNDINKSRAKYEAKRPKYEASATLQNKSARTVKSVSVDFVFLEIPTGRELVRYPLQSELTILPGHKKKIERDIFDTAKDIANFSPPQGESLLQMGPVRVRVVISRVEYADGSVWELPKSNSPEVKD
jgi:hypothetical protein